MPFGKLGIYIWCLKKETIEHRPATSLPLPRQQLHRAWLTYAPAIAAPWPSAGIFAGGCWACRGRSSGSAPAPGQDAGEVSQNYPGRLIGAADCMKERAGSLLKPGHVYVSFPAGRSSGKSCHGSMMTRPPVPDLPAAGRRGSTTYIPVGECHNLRSLERCGSQRLRHSNARSRQSGSRIG